MENPTEIRLTQTVQKGGCAAKLPPGQLKKILSDLRLQTPKELLVGTENLDDAALWDLGNGQLLVQTLDFFTPIVDDPYDFGAIAAANALSDIYAMGGEPKIALSILAFPSMTLPFEILGPLMKGATDQIHKAGACLAGGHSIDDDTLKLGFSVTGFVNREKAWTNKGAQSGDVLILTKALGTGTITSGIKRGEAKAEWVAAAVESMKQLNQVPSLLKEFDVHAATDITGFGLAGHCLQMAHASHKRFEFNINKLPVLLGAMDSLKAKIINRAHKTNGEYIEGKVQFNGISEEQRLLTVDPQTSGGLLLCVPENQETAIVQKLKKYFPATASIGEVTELRGHPIAFVR